MMREQRLEFLKPCHELLVGCETNLSLRGRYRPRLLEPRHLWSQCGKGVSQSRRFASHILYKFVLLDV